MSGNHSVQYLYTYTVGERGRWWGCPTEKKSFVLRDCPEERLVAMVFQDPSLLQFSQDLIQQTEWIPCQDTVIPHLFLWRWTFLTYNRAPVPIAHVCCRGSVQPKKRLLISVACFPNVIYIILSTKICYQKVISYGKARKSGMSTNLWGSSGSQFGRKLVTASATSSFNSTSQSPSVARIRTSSGPCSYCRRS